MSGFGDFLIGAVAGGLEGVEGEISKDRQLGRQKDLEQWRLQQKRKYDALTRADELAAATDPARIKEMSKARLLEFTEDARLRRAQRDEKIAELEALGEHKRAEQLRDLEFESDKDYRQFLRMAADFENELAKTAALDQAATANVVSDIELEGVTSDKTRGLLDLAAEQATGLMLNGTETS
jgi:hypothetical protein